MRQADPTQEDLAALAACDPDRILVELDQIDCQDPVIGLRKYIELSWSIIEPGRTYVPNWHIDCISDHLMAVSQGHITRILINVPPGGMKSLLTDAFWPSHEWGPQGKPELRYVSASYNIDLTVRDNRRTRSLITSDWYQERWGDRFQLVGDQNAKTRFDNDRMGFKIATSVGGLGTGERGDRFICFPGDQLVMTERGPVEIGEIVRRRLDARVWSMDVDTGQCGWHPITGWHENPGGEIVEVVLDDGALVRCTPDHRLWTSTRGWVRADELRSDDVLPSSSGPNSPDQVGSNSVLQAEGLVGQSARSDLSNVVGGQSRGGVGVDEVVVTDLVGDVLPASAVQQIGQAVVGGVVVPVAGLLAVGSGPHECQQHDARHLQLVGLSVPAGVEVAAGHAQQPARIPTLRRVSDLGSAGHHLVGDSDSTPARHLVPGEVGDRSPLLVRRIGWADRTFCLSVETAGAFFVGHDVDVITHRPIFCKNCDDPHNIKDGESTAKRNEVLLWFSEVVPTRLSDPRRSAIIVIMQRVHEADVAGLILEKELGYTHLNLPMEFEPDRRCFVEVTGWSDPRQEENELLWKDHMPREVVERDKRAMGSYAVAAQFQQRPAPRGGGMFQRIWWQFYETGHKNRPRDVTERPARPRPPSFDMVVASVDAAFKSTASGSRVGLVVVGVVGPYRYVLDNRTRPMTFTETVNEILDVLKTFPRCNRVLIEDKANGPAIIDTLSQKVSGIIAVNPEGGKEARAAAMTASVESGHWLLPEGASWLEDFIHEFATFPAAAKNDQVDASSQASTYLTHGATITRVLGLLGAR